jgi:signal transduction histidine kinase
MVEPDTDDTDSTDGEKDSSTDGDAPRIRLLMADTENTRLLSRWLSESYTVERPSTDPLSGAFDLAIFDTKTFRRLDPEQLRARREREAPVALPYLLLTRSKEIREDPTVWEHVDDVIATPIEQDVLHGRLESLLRTRRLSLELERKNQRLDRFTSVVSHDLRNPLAVADGWLDLAEQGHDEGFERIADALDRMEQLIDDVLTLTKQGEDVADPTPTDVGKVAQTAWEYVDAPEATLDCEPDLPVVLADQSRLQQLLENLFRNAVDHGPATVTVRVTATADGFAVADDGPGIPPEERAHVFESGYTTDENGTGLGLDIVERIADAHGWDVSVEESRSGGARFVLSGVQRAESGVQQTESESRQAESEVQQPESDIFGGGK